MLPRAVAQWATKTCPVQLAVCFFKRSTQAARLGNASRSRITDSIRHFSSVRGLHDVNTITLDCGSKGPISLDIFQAKSPVQKETWSGILYLPAGPVMDLHTSSMADEAIIAELLAAVDVPIVKVNYRAGQNAPFPTAIHDVLTGYDWLVSKLSQNDKFQDGATMPRIGVVGQLFGGGLGTSLALTECHKASKAKVVAAALNNPIVDWAVPDRVELASYSATLEEVGCRDSEMIKAKTKRAKSSSNPDSSWTKNAESSRLSVENFLKARQQVFNSQNAYFDNFASPIHWFRTPGIETKEDTDRMSSDEDEPVRPELLRRYRLGYPPAGSGLELPHIHMYSSESSILRSQHEDLISHLKTAEIANYLRARKITLSRREQTEGDQEEIEYITHLVTEKFVLQSDHNDGLWGPSTSDYWRRDIRRIADWFKQLL